MSFRKFIYSLMLLLFFVFGMGFHVQSQSNEIVAENTLKEKLKIHLNLGLDYMKATQIRESSTVKGQLKFKGEWPSYMCLQRAFFLLGGKKDIYDSNCFSVAATHNSLAQIYLEYPEYTSIPSLLDLSFEKIMTYQEGLQFNFWCRLVPNRKLKRGDVIGQQGLVRRPTNYRLGSKYINNAANVLDDSDDTGLGYIAIALRKQIQVKENKDTNSIELPKIGPIFDQYRDIDRNNRHWYNYLFGNDHETGAYLTWLGPEYQFKRWHIIKVTGHNATFFLPFSECFPHAYIPYLPYGSNDLDGVVNANVLSALAIYDELDAKGVKASVAYIEKRCKEDKLEKVGIYYPNRYQFPYAVSEAYSNGVDALDSSVLYLVDYILERQQEDGSWLAHHGVNKKDTVQSTAYALNALLNFGALEQRKTIEPIEKSIHFLMAKSIADEQGIHWNGGVFFSGGTVVRKALVWKSDAFTTAIILKAFAKYRRYLEIKCDLAAE